MSEHKYVSLANRLRRRILSGEVSSGSKLPSENELIEKYGYSRQTVRHAMRLLEEEGLTRRVRGSGTYVTGKSKENNIAIVTTYISEYIFTQVLSGMQSVLAKNGYTSMLAVTQNKVDTERKVLLELMKKPIDAMIVEGTKTALPNPNLKLYREIAEMGIPIVFFHGYYRELENSIYVVTDDRKGGYDVCTHLINKGHKRIAGIFKGDDMQGHERYAGMITALIDNGLDADAENIIWFTTESRKSRANEYALKLAESCTGIVCYNDEIAVAIIDILTKNGIRVPEDVELVSLDNSFYANVSSTRFLSLNHPKERLGEITAQKLLNIIEGKEETSEVLDWA